MKQVNNGFADYYYLQRDGTVYNATTDKIMQPDKEHTFTLRTIEHKRKKIALKTLYKLVYNEPYCKDNIDNLDNEEWKLIDDTDGLYYISNRGRVKSLQGYEAIILKGFKNKSGYYRVDIIERGKRQTKLIHRLVAAAFLPLPNKIDMQLHHKDFDKSNNDALNLIWLSTIDHKQIHSERNLEADDKRQGAKPESNHSK